MSSKIYNLYFDPAIWDTFPKRCVAPDPARCPALSYYFEPAKTGAKKDPAKQEDFHRIVHAKVQESRKYRRYLNDVYADGYIGAGRAQMEMLEHYQRIHEEQHVQLYRCKGAGKKIYERCKEGYILKCVLCACGSAIEVGKKEIEARQKRLADDHSLAEVDTSVMADLHSQIARLQRENASLCDDVASERDKAMSATVAARLDTTAAEETLSRMTASSVQAGQKWRDQVQNLQARMQAIQRERDAMQNSVELAQRDLEGARGAAEIGRLQLQAEKDDATSRLHAIAIELTQVTAEKDKALSELQVEHELSEEQRLMCDQSTAIIARSQTELEIQGEQLRQLQLHNLWLEAEGDRAINSITKDHDHRLRQVIALSRPQVERDYDQEQLSQDAIGEIAAAIRRLRERRDSFKSITPSISRVNSIATEAIASGELAGSLQLTLSSGSHLLRQSTI